MFKKLRKKFLTELVDRQAQELERMRPLLASGLLPDGREFYILKRKLGESREQLTELEQSEPVDG